MTYRPFSLGRRGRRFLALALVACMVCAALPQALAANPEVDAGMVYCFQSAEFQTGASDDLTGICVTGVPQGSLGTVQLGSRVICPGDILTTGQLDAMTFHPTSSGGQEAQLTYLPIYGNRVEKTAVMTISIRSKENQPPVAENVSLETYNNLELTGNLTAKDPEDGKLTFTLVQAPKRGEVTIGEDGSFTYTPKKNKVGKDSFSFTAADEAGAVSNEATVTIEILKPLDNTTYQDMTQTAHEFEALWMKNTGLFSGSQVAGENCFGPEETVTRGDFLAMVMKLLEVPLETSVTASGFADEADAPDWLLPYLATAMRLGVVSGSREGGKVVFRPNDVITSAEAAVMLQNVLLLPVSASATVGAAAPVWAQDSVQAMTAGGVSLPEANAPVTRLDAAVMLYQVSKLAETAPGLEVFRRAE